MANEEALEHFEFIKTRRRNRIIVVVVGAVGILGFFSTFRKETDYTWIRKAPLADVQKRMAGTDPEGEVGYMYAYRLLMEGHQDEAYSMMKSVVAKTPGNVKFLMGLARAASTTGDALGSIGAYERVVQIAPANVEAHYAIARIQFQAGLVTDALGKFETAKKLKSDILKSSLDYGICLFQKGRLPEAENQFDSVIGIVVLEDRIFPFVVEIGMKNGNTKLALAKCLRRMEINNTYPYGLVRDSVVRLLLTDKMNAKQLEAAESFARSAVTDPAPIARFQGDLARVLVVKGDLKGARAAALAGLKLDKEDQTCLSTLIDICKKSNETQGASRYEKLLAGVKAKEALRKPTVVPGQELAAANKLAGLGYYSEAVEIMLNVAEKQGQAADFKKLLESYRTAAIKAMGERTFKEEHTIIPTTFAP